MNLYKIIIYSPEKNYYYHTEEIYCDNSERCKELYEQKYPGYIFEIMEVI